MTKNNLSDTFKDKEYFKLAMTHKSWVNEHHGTRRSNERLEFLGDAILEFVVSKRIYEEFPNKEEGYLTALRANLVNTISLAKVATRLDLGSQLFLSKGEEEGGGRKNTSILADTLEAVIGAYFLDGGLEAAEKFINDNLLKYLNEYVAEPLKDAKSNLQEIIQAKGFPAPKYQVVSEIGPDHDKEFTVEVLSNGDSLGKGVGKNKSEAEQEAAEVALKKVS
ncbi:ribonuclease III [Patescibacteria group bacterium]|nr:ribonuclease III [Patescibacteria group bacterium]